MTTSTGEVDPSEGEGLWCWGWDGAYGIRGWGVVALGGTVGGGVLRSEIVGKDQKIESTRAQPPAAPERARFCLLLRRSQKEVDAGASKGGLGEVSCVNQPTRQN